MAGLCLLHTVRSQSVIPVLTPGDSIPDVALDFFNYKKPAGRLSEFKDDYVLLDFWRISCTPCIKAMPKIDSLQQQFAALRVFLVSAANDNRLNELEEFYARKKESMPWLQRLPMIYHDSLICKYINLQSLPTYVWIRKGVLWDITGGDGLTADKIRDFLAH